MSWSTGIRLVAKGLLSLLATTGLSQIAQAATIWGPMWDVRQTAMNWQLKASDTSINVHAFFADSGTIQVFDSGNNLRATLTAPGDKSSGPLAATVGEVFTMRIVNGFHIRPHWDGVEWIRLGEGLQGIGPGTGRGFQSDAELGFDARWNDLPAIFADTTWSYNVGANETLKVSVEHMTGDVRGARQFEFISPSGIVYVADADGMAGSGAADFQARGGNLLAAPNPASIYWEEYTAPTSEVGVWGFRLRAHEGEGIPYAWHYVLDRTDGGNDQFSYLREGALLDPDAVPAPPALVLLCSGSVCLFGYGWRRRRARTTPGQASNRT